MLILFGYPSCGKTTLGQLLAKELGVSFVDTDHQIEKQWGMSCKALVQQNGEEFFRDCEQQVIESLHPMDAIVAVGGGSLLRGANREWLKNIGITIYLKIELEELKKRLSVRGIPATADSFDALYHSRKSIYEAYADRTVDIGDKSIPFIIEELTAIWSKKWALKHDFVRE